MGASKTKNAKLAGFGRIILGVLVPLSLSANAAVAAGAEVGLEQFAPVAAFAPKTISFDDISGKGFEWNKPLPCGANRATVTIKFGGSYTGGKSGNAPVAKVWLRSGGRGEPSEQWIAAVLLAPTDTYKLNGMAWLEKVDGSISSGPGYAPADLRAPFKIGFSWRPDGSVDVDFDGEYVKHITADRPLTGIGLGGSLTKVKFLDLQVGRSGAPDKQCKPPTTMAAR